MDKDPKRNSRRFQVGSKKEAPPVIQASAFDLVLLLLGFRYRYAEHTDTSWLIMESWDRRHSRQPTFSHWPVGPGAPRQWRLLGIIWSKHLLICLRH